MKFCFEIYYHFRATILERRIKLCVLCFFQMVALVGLR